MSDIETDFQVVADQINAKIKEAALVLQEANDLAKSVGAKYYDEKRSDDYYCYNPPEAEKALAKLVNFDPVLTALDNAGWQTSTMTADC